MTIGGEPLSSENNSLSAIIVGNLSAGIKFT